MSSHNLHNSTITQHMSVLGGGAGCWFTPSTSHQIPPTAPLRQKRQPTINQPLTVQNVMQQSSAPPSLHHMSQTSNNTFTPINPPNTFSPISPPSGFTPISPNNLCPQQPIPLSPKTPNGPQSLPQHQIMGHVNHHNSHLSNNSVSLHSMHPMSTSAQGAMLLNQQTHIDSSSMATSLQSMPGIMQTNHSILLPHHQMHNMNNNQNTHVPQQQSGLPDINSIQQGLPQPLRSNKLTESRSCNMPWHHGKITRERAENLLQPRTDGLFLVRESTNFPGDQTLCVCFQTKVEHYRIKCTSNSTLTIDDEEFFETLPQLIDHYLQDADGLCTQLMKPLPKQQQQQQPSLSNANICVVPPRVTQASQQVNQPTITQSTQLNAKPQIPQVSQTVQQPPTVLNPTQTHQQPSHANLATQQSQLSQHQANDHNPPNPCIAPQAFVDAGWMIAEHDLEIRENIGKGEFGDVMLGILKGQKVAVKMLKDSEAANKFLAEASLMTSLKHDNLVKLLGLVFNKQHICLVTEYMSKGSLVDYLRSRGRLHVTKRDQIMFAFDTCSGMEYLETRRVIHRDLAARNVLISDTRRAKVADFGLAREEGGPDAAAKLPIKWTAPEALKHNKFSNKSDMWSFGILLWEIYSFGRVPYPRIPLADVVKHVEKGYKMEAPEGCPPEVYELMRQAWDLNPDTRPTFSQAKLKLAQIKANTPTQ